MPTSITHSFIEPAMRCDQCPPGTSPHSANRLLSFLRAGEPHQIVTCDARVLLVIDEQLAHEGTTAIAVVPFSASERIAELELEVDALTLELGQRDVELDARLEPGSFELHDARQLAGDRTKRARSAYIDLCESGVPVERAEQLVVSLEAADTNLQRYQLVWAELGPRGLPADAVMPWLRARDYVDGVATDGRRLCAACGKPFERNGTRVVDLQNRKELHEECAPTREQQHPRASAAALHEELLERAEGNVQQAREHARAGRRHAAAAAVAAAETDLECAELEREVTAQGATPSTTQ